MSEKQPNTSSDDDFPIHVDSEKSVSELRQTFYTSDGADYEVFNTALESVSKLKQELADMAEFEFGTNQELFENIDIEDKDEVMESGENQISSPDVFENNQLQEAEDILASLEEAVLQDKMESRENLFVNTNIRNLVVSSSSSTSSSEAEIDALQPMSDVNRLKHSYREKLESLDKPMTSKISNRSEEMSTTLSNVKKLKDGYREKLSNIQQPVTSSQKIDLDKKPSRSVSKLMRGYNKKLSEVNKPVTSSKSKVLQERTQISKNPFVSGVFEGQESEQVVEKIERKDEGKTEGKTGGKAEGVNKIDNIKRNGGVRNKIDDYLEKSRTDLFGDSKSVVDNKTVGEKSDNFKSAFQKQSTMLDKQAKIIDAQAKIIKDMKRKINKLEAQLAVNYSEVSEV